MRVTRDANIRAIIQGLVSTKAPAASIAIPANGITRPLFCGTILVIKRMSSLFHLNILREA